jgi:hypothetical protein
VQNSTHFSVLKAATKNIRLHKMVKIRVTFDFSAEAVKARKERTNIFQTLRENNYNQNYHIQQSFPSIFMEK